MVPNYHYIVAGLPDILLDFEQKPLDFTRIVDAITQTLSPKDQRLIEWLQRGLAQECLSPHFHRAAAKIKNSFIRDYFAFDLEMRQLLATVSLLKEASAPANALQAVKNQSDLSARLFAALETEHIVEREQKLDRLRWERATEICTFHYFDIDVILCFLLKVSIVKRWMHLDKARGQKLFKELVTEIKTVKYNENQRNS